MIPERYTYLLLDLGTILFPFLLSFDKRVSFYKSWVPLFKSVAIVGFVFIIWDIWFTHEGIWEFNSRFVCGWYIFNLPVEEILFFIVVPYACVFIYACLSAYVKFDLSRIKSQYFSMILVLILILFGGLNYYRLYTVVTFFIGAGLILVLTIIRKSPYINWYYLTYLIHLIPFFICNGILTSKPVLIYNNTRNLSIRLGTIPLEDTVYSFVLVVSCMYFYDYFRVRLAFNKAVC